MKASKAHPAVSAFQAFVLALAIGVALAVVLIPVLPGETPLDVGDVAFTTFEANGATIVREGEVVTQSSLSRITAAGLLDNEIGFGEVFSGLLLATLAGAFAGIYLYLFQPPEVNTNRRLIMYGLLIVLWVAGAKVFFSQALPDDDRLYLSYMLPIATAPMLIAALLDAGLALFTAALLAVVATFAGFYMPDARQALSVGPMESLQMVDHAPADERPRRFRRSQRRAHEQLRHRRRRSGSDDDRLVVHLLAAPAEQGRCRPRLDPRRRPRRRRRIGRDNDGRRVRPGRRLRCGDARSADGAGAAQPPAPARIAGEGARYVPPQRHRRQTWRSAPPTSPAPTPSSCASAATSTISARPPSRASISRTRWAARTRTTAWTPPPAPRWSPSTCARACASPASTASPPRCAPSSRSTTARVS